MVHEERIVDTGDLSELFEILLSINHSMPMLDEVVKRWNIDGATLAWPVRYIPSGSIIVPGMSGALYALILLETC